VVFKLNNSLTQGENLRYREKTAQHMETHARKEMQKYEITIIADYTLAGLSYQLTPKNSVLPCHYSPLPLIHIPIPLPLPHSYLLQ